jgi:hypothetical protein
MSDSKQMAGFKKTLQRMLNTPPKPHDAATKTGKPANPKGRRPSSTSSKSERPRA